MNNNITRLILSSCAALAVMQLTPFAKAVEKGKGKAGARLMQMDKNGDGNISRDEAPAAIWERLSKLDKDSNDIITKEEMAGAMKQRTQGSSGQMFARMDKNKDGKLTADEASKGWDRISKADQNGDNAVSKEEWAKAMAFMQNRNKGSKPKGNTGAGSASIFGKYDEDKDSKLSKEEVPEQLWARLLKADKNADGLVSKTELEGVYSKMRSSNPEKDKPETPKQRRPMLEE